MKNKRIKLPTHPMQPIYLDEEGTIRFRGNAIIERLFRTDVVDLNRIASWDVPVEDKEQFWQLLGYSVSGYGELSIIREETVAAADKEADRIMTEK